MSFVLLLTTLVAFDIRAEQANQQALSVHFEDLANRVANAVLGAVDIGVQRASSESTAPSDELVYYQQIRIPTQIRGQDYRIALTEAGVVVSEDRFGISQDAPLFNLKVPATCTHTDAVCELTGTARSSEGFVFLKYEYKRATPWPSTDCTLPTLSSPLNCISIG